MTTFPHCDPRVLHAPGECKYCDMHPEWQELRRAWGISFTGHRGEDKDKIPCPAEQRRSITDIDAWQGNRAIPEIYTCPTCKDPCQGDNGCGCPPPNREDKTTLSGRPPEDPETPGAPAPIDPATGMHKDYWILSDEERAKGWVRPYRNTYVHKKCGVATTMGLKLSETYARDPKFYGSTFCTGCKSHFPVDQFYWDGTNEDVGS